MTRPALELRASTLPEWSRLDRLEVLRFLLDPRHQHKSLHGALPDLTGVSPEALEGVVQAALERALAVWVDGTVSLLAYIGLYPFRAFHFAADARLTLAQKTRLLAAFLDAAGNVPMFTDSLALARLAARQLGFALACDGPFDLGMGERHYYFLLRSKSPPTLRA